MSDELYAASGTAEMERLPGMVGMVRCRCRIHGHTANRIDHHSRRRGHALRATRRMRMNIGHGKNPPGPMQYGV
ncbi:hypothetical protein [Sphingomonas sp. UYAg733]